MEEKEGERKEMEEAKEKLETVEIGREETFEEKSLTLNPQG